MKNKILFVVSLLFGLVFINAGLNKFLNYMPVPKDLPASLMTIMGAMTQISWLIPLVGLVEIIGGILVIPSRTRALGAIILLPVMVGIMCIHIFNDQSGLPIAGPLFVILLWILIENRKRYRPMISKSEL